MLLAAVVVPRAVGAAPDAHAAVAVPAVTKVTVVDPPADDVVLVEAGVRIRAELDAVNLSNRAVTCAGGIGSAACDATASAAAIALSRQDGLATIRVIATLPDGYELHRLIRVPAAAGGDDPAVLAVRAVELLRDIYLDVPRNIAARREAPRPPPAAAPPVVQKEDVPGGPGDHTALRMFLGASALGGRRGLGPAVAPVLGAALPLGHGLSLSGAVAGPFSRLVGDSITGSATTTQALAMVGGRFELEFRGVVSPFVALATGVHYIRVEGAPFPEMKEITMSSSAISPLFAFGAGISFWFRRWLAATTQVEAFYTQPITDVVVGNEVVGRAGGPSWLAQIGLSVSLGER
ncbi:MAG TPA: hypothetical protein VN903_04210 [Polyangia bacterium]|nr:hypothetical protein [Polyangia bacterium]